jgi:hypothetical protein
LRQSPNNRLIAASFSPKAYRTLHSHPSR